MIESLAPRVGLEPTTLRLTAECSTIELSRNIKRHVPSKPHIVLHPFSWTTVGSSNLFELPTHSVAAVTSNPLRFFSVPFASQISCLPLKRSCMQASILAFPSSMLLSSCFWSSPRPISDSQLHALPHFHLCPIYLVVFKGSYSFRWDISSWGGLHA